MKNIILIAIMVFILYSFTGCSNDFSDSFKEGYEDATKSEEVEAEVVNNALEISGEKSSEIKEEIVSDGIVEKLVSFGFTDEEAEEQRKILLQCGITSIDICEPTDEKATIDGLISFRGEIDKDRIFWFTVDNRNIFYIALNGEDLYDSDKGGFIKTFDEVHIPETHVDNDVYILLREKTEKVLDGYFPYNTRYYDAWGVGRKDNEYMVKCQISDGRILTDDWIWGYVWYEEQNGEFTPINVQIDGQSYELK